MALSTVFHSINSPDNFLLSHAVLPVLFLPYWSFWTIHLFIKVSLSPNIILCGPLGLQHHTILLTSGTCPIPIQNMSHKIKLRLAHSSGHQPVHSKHSQANPAAVARKYYVKQPMTHTVVNRWWSYRNTTSHFPRNCSPWLSKGLRTAMQKGQQQKRGWWWLYLKLCTEVVILLPLCCKQSVELCDLLLVLVALFLQLVAPNNAGCVHLKVHRTLHMPHTGQQKEAWYGEIRQETDTTHGYKDL